MEIFADIFDYGRSIFQLIMIILTFLAIIFKIKNARGGANTNWGEIFALLRQVRGFPVRENRHDS